MGAAVNSAAHENCAMLTPDGKYLLFTRAGDIYWVDARILEEFRPAKKRGQEGVKESPAQAQAYATEPCTC
jgi:hypothetical protein